MKMIINKEKSSSAKSSPRYSSNTNETKQQQSPRITSTASFFLNPPSSTTSTIKTKLPKPHRQLQHEENKKNNHEAITSLVDNVINQAARNIQSSGSSINLTNNQMMSSSLSSSSGLVEGSSRSSSSIDTGSNTNTDELLNAGTDLIVNNSDLSGSSRRSSINDIGMDVDLEPEFFQKTKDSISNLYIKNNMSAEDIDKPEQFNDKIKATDLSKVSKSTKKQRQNNYFNRSRRGRIVKTPPIEWSQLADDDDNGKISDQLDSPRSEKVSEELYDYYLKNRNLNLEKEEEEDHFIKTNNYTSIESLKLKFDAPNNQKDRSKPIVSNWLSNSYNDSEERNLKTPENDLKKGGFFPKSPQQQQDKPVFKYLSKNLINNLFVKENGNNEPTNNPSKVKSKFLTDDQQQQQQQKPLTITTSQEKLSPSSINYNYLIKKYSPARSNSDSKPKQFNKLSSETNKLDTTKKINSSIVSIIKDLVTDAIDESKPKASAATKAENRLSDELEVAVTVELESDEDIIDDTSLLTYSKLTMNHLSINPNDDDDSIICDDNTYKNTEMNRGYLSPRERINAALNEETTAVQLPQQQRPLIKTLINDITKLKSDTYLTSCLDYLNENFNKTLDDLVELEDTKQQKPLDESIMSNPELTTKNTNKNNSNNNSLLLDLKYDAIKLSNDSLNSNNQKRQISSRCSNEQELQRSFLVDNNNNNNNKNNEINLFVESKIKNEAAILSKSNEFGKEELSRDSEKETNNSNKNNNFNTNNISCDDDPIDLNYLNNYAKLYVENVQNLHESENTDNYNKCTKNHHNNSNNNNNNNKNEKANHTTSTSNKKNNNYANTTSEESIPAEEVEEQKQPREKKGEEEEHLLKRSNKENEINEFINIENNNNNNKNETTPTTPTIRIEHEAYLQAADDSNSTLNKGEPINNKEMLDSATNQEESTFICKRIPSVNSFNETIPEEELNSSSIISDVIDSEEEEKGAEAGVKASAGKIELETGINTAESIEADIESNVNEAIDSLINQLDDLHSEEKSDLVSKEAKETVEEQSIAELEAARLKVNTEEEDEAQLKAKINDNHQQAEQIVNDFKSHGLRNNDNDDEDDDDKSHEVVIVNDFHLNKQKEEKEELEQQQATKTNCISNTNSETVVVLTNNEDMNNNLDNPFKKKKNEDLNKNLPSKSTTLPNSDINPQKNDLTQQHSQVKAIEKEEEEEVEANKLIIQQQQAEQIVNTAATAAEDLSKDTTLTAQITNLEEEATANEPVNNTNSNNINNNHSNSNLDEVESDLSINRLSAIERIPKEDNIKIISGEKLSSLDFNIDDDLMNSTNSTNQDQDESIMNSSDLDVTSCSNNVKKVVLKNKEIVLVESCSDDDEKELKQLIHRKNTSPTEELFPYVVAQERRARKPRPLPTLSPLDFPTPTPPSTFAPSSTTSNSSYLNSSNRTKTDINSSNDEDDPFVKAALERFDAFCKSKSTQNLDTAGVPTPSSSPSPIITQRQKSPFLTRKIITQPSEDPKMKESIGSFIKRRQARIDPNLLHKNASSTPNGSDSESKSASKPPMFSRSVSETREPQHELFGNSRSNNDSLKQQQVTQETPSTVSSSLAKRFLGSLTPQLEPMVQKPQLPSKPEPVIKEEPIIEKSPEMPVRKSVLQTKGITKNEPNSNHMINRTSSAPSAMPLNLRSNHERRCSTSSNSSTDSESKTPRGTKNVIKLEVVNGQKVEKTPSPEKTNYSKPPLPPVNAAVTSHTSTVNAGAWRSSKATENSQETVTESKPTVANLVSKPPSPKPGVRMIPLEVKNTKSRMIPLEVKTNGTTISRSNSKSEKVLNNSFNVTPPVSGKALEKSGFLSANSKAEQQTTVDSRPRSLSSFRIERESTNGANLRNASSFSYRENPSLSSGLSTSHSGNLNNNPEFNRGLPTEPNTKSNEDSPDPIVEKACSNFMYKLMEFQRHQKPYLPSTTPTAVTSSSTAIGSKPEYTTSSTLLSASASPSTSSSNLYSGPIVSSRTSNLSDYNSSRFTTDNAALSVPATPLLGNSTTTSVPYSAPYLSSYSNNFSFPSSASSLSRYSGTENIYKTDLSKFSGDTDSSSPRPYVSAIRKRRTLFDDLQSGGDNQEALTNQYLIPQNYSSNKSLAEAESYNTGRQRPLSIVSEEANSGYHPLIRSLSAKGDSRLSNEMNKSYLNHQQQQQKEESTPNGSTSTYKLSRPPLKKSNSTTSAEKQQQKEQTPQTSAQPKLRSTVFDRLAALNSSNSSKLSANKTQLTNSNLNLNLETPDTLNKKTKNQNEIAIVTNMTPATSKKDLSQYSSTNSAATLNRIRSLDSKSRDKLRNKDYMKKTPSTSLSTSTKLGKSQKDLSESTPTTRRLKSAGTASNTLPPAAPQSISSSNSTSPTPSSFNSNSNPSFNETTKPQNTSTATTPRTDVFERLSKRTNSLKNLANNSNNNTNANNTNSLRKKSTSNRSATNSSSSSSDHDTDGKCSPTEVEPHRSDRETNQNTLLNSHTNSLSKTSVFERLYKSNIAAHQSLKNTEHSESVAAGSSLKKNMSNSTASLASSTPSTSSNLSRKSNLTPRGRANLTKSKVVKVRVDDDEASKTQDELEDQSISSN